jgi:hypothetical protein
MRPVWFPDWPGHDCLIVASGPSAVEQPIAAARGRCKAIVINNSWWLAPWAEILYACDAEWWQSGNGNDFAGLKVSRSHHPGVMQVRLRPDGEAWCNRILMDEMGEIGAGGSSCFQALNLAVQFGCRRIALVGCDARIDKGKHWHPDHGGRLKNPVQQTADIWVRSFQAAAQDLVALGVEVTNCSPDSAINAFVKAPLAHWIDGCSNG